MLLTLIVFQLAFIPQVIPIFLLVVYSFWIPQIWRNARRGNAHSLEHPFVLGTTLGRLALPLCAYTVSRSLARHGTSLIMVACRHLRLSRQCLLHRHIELDLGRGDVATISSGGHVRTGTLRSRFLVSLVRSLIDSALIPSILQSTETSEHSPLIPERLRFADFDPHSLHLKSHTTIILSSHRPTPRTRTKRPNAFVPSAWKRSTFVQDLQVRSC